MSPGDYLLNIALIALVVRQMRGRPLTTFNLILPLALVAGAAAVYLRGFPTGGKDLVLELGGAAVGLLLGIGCAMTTAVRPGPGGVAVAKAGVVAAGLWIVGVGARLGFELYATHGGAAAIRRFSVAHQITSAEAWVSALLLMALCQVVTRTGLLYARSFASAGGAPEGAEAALNTAAA